MRRPDPTDHRVLLRRRTGQTNRMREIIELLSTRLSIIESRDRDRAQGRPPTESFPTFKDPEPPRVRYPSRGNYEFWDPESPIAGTWITTTRSSLRPLDPPPGWRCFTGNRVGLRIGFTVFGMTTDEIDEVVSKVEERQLSSRDFIPVFVSDNDDFEVFRSRGYVFEYVPKVFSRCRSNQRAERRYLKQRLDIITAKWGLSELVDLST
jgi:hypothetical protein